MAITALCVSADLANRASTVGVNLRVDDDTTTAAWACKRGSLDVYEACCPRPYTAAQLQGSAAATEYAADCGLWWLCLRRLNPIPKTVQVMYDILRAKLLNIQAGKIAIFDIIPSSPNCPLMSNITHMLEPNPHSVVNRLQSTGGSPTSFRQHLGLPDYDYLP